MTVNVSSTAGTPTGSVQLSVDGGTATSQSLTNGSATFTLISPSAGSHALSATYAAQGNFAASTATGTLQVIQAATFSLISAPGITYNSNGTVTVNVGSPAGTPTGSVQLSVDGGTPTALPLTNGAATFTLNSPSAGSHPLSAIYAAQGNFAASSVTGILQVDQAATSSSISSPEITYNSNGSVTVTVSSTAGIPTGNVQLSVDGGTATSLPLTGGTATFTLTSPAAGSHSLSASYAAQGNFAASTATGTLQVDQAATSSSISAPELTYNSDGSVTVTVSSTAGTPTGNVQLSVDGATATSLALTDGSATFTLNSPSAGSHALSATYAAQGNFAASTTTGTLQVDQASTSSSISAPEITYNSDGSVTVTVSSTAGTPTGNVQLSVDGGTATSLALTDGSATFTLTSPSAGSHSLSAIYAAQGDFAASTATGTLQVDQAATSSSISAPEITYNSDGSVTVTVSSTAGIPTGNVQLSVDGGTATSLPLTDGSATFTLTSPAAGSHSLSASYAAQGNFAASTATGTLQVDQAATAASISAPEITYNSDGSVTVTVSSTAGTPTGSVQLSVDGGTATSQAMNDGSATFTLTSPSAGSHSLSASYAAQGNFAASTATGTLQVDQAATSSSISAPEITYNSDGSVTVTVSSTAGTPTGNVQSSVDGYRSNVTGRWPTARQRSR